MPDKKYSNLEIHKALKTIIRINYNYRWLDVDISPKCVNWYAAVQFRNDPKKNWMPRVFSFYQEAQKVAVKCSLDDSQPTYVNAETIMVMAESRAQSPTPPIPAV
jgi:hypothetical protein